MLVRIDNVVSNWRRLGHTLFLKLRQVAVSHLGCHYARQRLAPLLDGLDIDGL
jgi:hypothetical protein